MTRRDGTGDDEKGMRQGMSRRDGTVLTMEGREKRVVEVSMSF